MQWWFLALVALSGCWTSSVPSPAAAPAAKPKPSARRAASELPSDQACPVKLLHRHRPDQPGPARHLGVDFRMCESQRVIAIADGIVIDAQHEQHEGGYVIIQHTPSPTYGSVRMWYVHVNNIRVAAGDRVARGDVLADFWESDDIHWIRHVHLFWSGSQLPVEEQDPLRLLTACQSQAQDDEYIYPVDC
jgi:hypothetical protein